MTAHVHAVDAQRLFTLISDCDVEPPEELAGLLETLDAVRAAGVQPDPTVALINDTFANKLRGAELRKRITAASAAQYAVEYGHALPQRAEPAAMHAFTEALENGAADSIIASLTPRFNAAAEALVSCHEHIDPDTDADQVLAASTDDRVRVAWQDIDRHVGTLEKIGQVVTQFGAKSPTFGMIKLPAGLSGIGALDDRVLMCVDANKLGVVAAGAIFNVSGTHRRSPWFRVASVLKLNTISEARETVRAWAEASWDSLDLNRGRGRMEGDKFVAMPVANPYAKAAT